MTKILWIFCLLFFSTSLLSCDKEKKSSEEKTEKVSVRQEWFPNANFAGEIVASKVTDEKNNLEITVEAGADDIDPIKLVLSGKNDFGIVGADKVLTANEKGAELIVIGVLNYNSPTIFISKTDDKILSPKDFYGKNIGILTGTATEYVYRTLIKKANIDSKKLKEVEAPFDLKSFITDSYDLRPAFAYDEPVSLDQSKIKYNVIKPEDYGVEFLGTVYFTTKKNILERPDMVQSFINSVAEGWEISIKQPEKAVKLLKEYDNKIDENRERESLIKAIPYFVGQNGKVLECDFNHWNEMLRNLQELGVIKTVDLKSTIDNRFVQNYHKLKK